MYGASFTKAVFAYLVKYKDLASDARYTMITARMLLSHTSGFPNFRWINPDKKLDIKFTPGTQYSYSGEGINLLQFVIEEITHKNVGDMMRERIFIPLGMTRTSMTWQPQFEDDYAIGYDEGEKPLGHEKRETPRAAGSMDTTISDYARFVSAVMQGKGLKERFKNEMLTPQIAIHSPYQFPTPTKETTDENRGIALSYGLGWGLFRTPYGKAYFKEGHDDGWENHSVCFPDKKIGIVLMSNSSNGDRIFKDLLETVLKDTYTPWRWENYIPYNQAK